MTQQRTTGDFAHQMRWLVDEACPDVPVIRLVLDNLNTHRMASLYETFPPIEARRIAKKLEFHHTPKHGSWLNMAEIEFSVLARACPRVTTPMKTPCKGTSVPARRNATTPEQPSIGSSQPRMPEPRCVAYILTLQL